MGLRKLFLLALILTLVSTLGSASTVLASAKININTANATLLDALPGIGPSKAAAIVQYRTEHGLFSSAKDIQNVSGIGPATFAKLESLITVDVAPVVAPIVRSVVSVPVQTKPTVITQSYTKTQSVDSKISPNTATEAHANGDIAPAAQPEVAAAGAALAPIVPHSVTPQSSLGSGMFQSIWTFALIGVIVVASGAFILL